MKKNWIRRVVSSGMAAMMVLGMSGNAFAEETVNVNLAHVSGGAVLASYISGATEVYLPIGQNTAVPKGTQLSVWTSTTGISRKEGMPQRAFLQVNGVNVSDEKGRNTYTFTVQEDTSVTAGFTVAQRNSGGAADGHYVDLVFQSSGASDEDYIYSAFQLNAGSMSKQLALYYDDSKVDFSQAAVQLSEVYSEGAGGTEREGNPGQFTLTPDGALSSNSALEPGLYELTFSVLYAGEQEELMLDYQVGIAGGCSFPIYEVVSNGHTRYGENLVVTYGLNTASTVGDIINAFNAQGGKTIQGYQLAGWKNPDNGAALTPDMPVASLIDEEGCVDISPVFQSTADGSTYQVIVQ